MAHEIHETHEISESQRPRGLRDNDLFARRDAEGSEGRSTLNSKLTLHTESADLRRKASRYALARLRDNDLFARRDAEGSEGRSTLNSTH